MLSACASKEANNRLLANDWTNGKQPCGENHMSFVDRKIAYYPKGKEVLVLAEIMWMRSMPNDPELTIVQTRPSLLALQGLQKQGIDLSKDVHPTYVFKVKDGRLSLIGTARNEVEPVVMPSARQKNVFDLIACSA
jgi:hypothetical protein